jgi:putative ABC transport system permease protein
VAGETVSGRVTSLRSVQWDSFNVNFFMVFPPGGALEGKPATWITSFHLPGADRGLLTDLVQHFPSVTVLDVDALLARVRGIMEQAVLAVEYVFAFTLAAGFLVFAAAVQATLDERRLEGAVMRTLGGHRRQLALALATEFGILGALAGLLGAVGAVAVGWVVATVVLELPYHPALWLPLAGAAGGALALALAGSLGARPVLNHPPVASLRSG